MTPFSVLIAIIAWCFVSLIVGLILGRYLRWRNGGIDD